MDKNTKPTERGANEETRELAPDALEAVNGAGDPFAGVPRVPVNSIDPEVREKAGNTVASII